MDAPKDVYERELESRRLGTATFGLCESRLANARLLAAAVFAALLYFTFGPAQLGLAWLLIPVVSFVALVILHGRVIRARDRSIRAERFYERGIARCRDEWMGKGSRGDRYIESGHPFAPDLDLFGKGSIFERISLARTRGGEDALARWLMNPAGPEKIRERQEAVREVAPRLELREELALLGDDLDVTISPEALGAWGNAPPVRFPAWLPLAAVAVGVVAYAALGLWLFGYTGLAPLAAAGLVELGLVAPFQGRIREVLSFAGRPASELELVSRILGRLETEQFRSTLLSRLSARLAVEGDRPSRRIRRLVRLQDLSDSMRNPFFLPFAYLALLPVHVAWGIERWRRTSGPEAAGWLVAAGELEAILSLAGYSFERPGDPFPEIVEEGPVFLARGVAHPLLPEGRAVRNDLDLGGELRLLVVSGSNMSGKSTLLRTVGANTVLALAGAPVRAESLTISELSVGASIRVMDSLLEGASRFYAEIRRIKEVVDLTGRERPVLFLLDELLHGTNSHDRALGAEGVVRGLVERGAIGLVTTHDLALGRVAEALSPRAANVHFEDRMEKGRMVFDYRLRSGVVARSNALDLMRAIGLDV